MPVCLSHTSNICAVEHGFGYKRQTSSTNDAAILRSVLSGVNPETGTKWLGSRSSAVNTAECLWVNLPILSQVRKMTGLNC